MLFINCNWDSTWWQWSVKLYTNSKEQIYRRRNNAQDNGKYRTPKVEAKRYKE
jgi:hypothetical protein